MIKDANFIGNNIRDIRKRVGLKACLLARRIGIREGPLSNIERGRCLPSSRVIMALARELNVPVDAFFARDRMETERIMRRNQVLPFRTDLEGAPLPDEIAQIGDELVSLVLELEDLAGASKRALISLHVPSERTEQGMEGLAQSVRDFMRIGDGVVFDYYELFETCGFRVVVLPLAKEAYSFSYYDPGNYNALFFINSIHNPERQLFRLAYELGHIYLETDRLLRPGVTASERISGGTRNGEELDNHHSASKFAAFFLMPAGAVRATIEQLGLHKGRWTYELLLRLKHRFGVSAQTFLYRLKELGYANESETESLSKMINAHYSRTGYGEPGSSRRLLTPNGRLWDLVLTAEDQPRNADRLKSMVRRLKKLGVEKR